MSHLVVVGGFTESKGALERVADMAVSMDMALDADVLTLRRGRKLSDRHLRQLMWGAKVLTHSAGIMAVPSDACARQLAIIAPPEPTGISSLMLSAAKKTTNHLVGATEHPRRDHLRVVAGNAAELALHPYANLKLIKPISQFSTIKHLVENPDLAWQTGYLQMQRDEFFPVLTEQERFDMGATPGTINNVGFIPGRHDELYVDPKEVLARVMWHMGDA